MAKSELSVERLVAEVAVAELQAKYKGRAIIAFGRDLDREVHRIPSGVFTIDWSIGGGFPRGRCTEITGPPSTGKTTTCMIAAAQCVAAGGNVLWAAAEEFDWSYAESIGIPADSRRFAIAHSEEGNVLLDTVIGALRSGFWDLVIIDSIAVLKNWEYLLDGKSGEISKSVGEEKRGGESKMFAEFMARMFASFALVTRWQEERRGVRAQIDKELARKKPDAKLVAKLEKSIEGETPRLPALLMINQVRAQGVMGTMASLDSPGGFGIKHGKSVEINFNRSEVVWASDGKEEAGSVKKLARSQEDKFQEILARRVFFSVTKCKIGPPGRTGTFLIGQSKTGPFAIGRPDRADEVARLGIRLGHITQAGSWYTIAGLSYQGTGQLIEALRGNAELLGALERRIIEQPTGPTDVKTAA